MSKRAILTIPDETGNKIEALARLRGIAFATQCRSLITERLNEIENASVTAGKRATNVASTPGKTEVMANTG